VGLSRRAGARGAVCRGGRRGAGGAAWGTAWGGRAGSTAARAHGGTAVRARGLSGRRGERSSYGLTGLACGRRGEGGRGACGGVASAGGRRRGGIETSEKAEMDDLGPLFSSASVRPTKIVVGQ
jgi:hypothetical protein